MDQAARREIAERLRCLLFHDGGNVADAASRLDVEEVSLRQSIDEASPFPTLDVLSAVVTVFGVDPTFLVTGVYSSATHRSVMEGGQPAVIEALRELAFRAVHDVVAQPTHEPVLRPA